MRRGVEEQGCEIRPMTLDQRFEQPAEELVEQHGAGGTVAQAAEREPRGRDEAATARRVPHHALEQSQVARQGSASGSVLVHQRRDRRRESLHPSITGDRGGSPGIGQEKAGSRARLAAFMGATAPTLQPYASCRCSQS